MEEVILLRFSWNFTKFYIFSGFFSGSSTLNSYSPDYFLTHDVILVIFNYRLGPLGFLSLSDKSLNVPGNAGLKDQQIVLEFVRDNIHNFGGDPNNVTLMGHSSGAGCVAFHCVAESSRGLFHRAVIMAGAPYGYDCDINWTKRLAAKLGFEGNLEDEKEILRFLEAVDVLQLAENGMALITDEDKKNYDLYFAFTPSIEPYVSDSTFRSTSIHNLVENAWSRDIDILIGAVANEGKVQSSNVKDFKELIFMDEIPRELKIHQNKEKSEEIREKFEPLFREIYFKDADEEIAWENVS
jgi:carboxylesterase type B